MGYDMTWRNAPAGQRVYFRLTDLGMMRYRALMIEFGMAFNDAPPPPWPHAEDFGLTAEEWWIFAYPDDRPNAQLDVAQRSKAEKMFAEMHKVLAAHTKAIPGIPLHKFGTIDGWIVLPSECVAAVAAWRAYCATHGEQVALKRVGDVAAQSYWKKWITYLGDAAAHDGFVVC